jgi:hypothetical protein
MALSGGLLWGSGRVRLWLLVFCFAAVVDLTLDFVLVPHLAEVGAALANSCAQVTAAVFVLGYTIRSFGPIDWQARVLARAVGVAVVAAGAGWLGIIVVKGPAGIAVGGLGALLVFAVLSRVLRTVPAVDGMWVTTAVRGPVGDAIARVVRGVTAPQPAVDHPNLGELLVIEAGLRAAAERRPPRADQ